jgi:hypothetical protein
MPANVLRTGESIFHVGKSKRRLQGVMVEHRSVFQEHMYALAVLRARKRRRQDLGDCGDLDKLGDKALLDRVQDEMAFSTLAETDGLAETLYVCTLLF